MILVDATPLQSEHRVRGVGTYTRQLSAELLQQFGPDRLGFVLERGEVGDVSDAIRARAVTMWRPHKPAQVYWMYNEVILRQTLTQARPALFHATDFNGLVVSPLWRTVATLYDLTGLKDSPSGAPPSIALSILRWRVYYHHKLVRADHLIAISQRVKDDVVATLGYPQERVTVIPLGVDTGLYRPQRGEGRFAAVPGPYVAYSGSAEPHKNVERLWTAFVRLSADHADLRLYVCGRWRSEQVGWLQRAAGEAGLHDRVEHLGYLSAADQVSLYANAAMFVFPSLEEGFGLPVIEAMACGAPVVTSDRSVLPEVAGDAALLVDPYSTDAIAHAMGRLLTEPGLADEVMRRGFRRAEDYSWRETAVKTAAVYEQVLADR